MFVADLNPPLFLYIFISPFLLLAAQTETRLTEKRVCYEKKLAIGHQTRFSHLDTFTAASLHHTQGRESPMLLIEFLCCLFFHQWNGKTD